MKRVLLTCCVLTLVSLVPRPASADSILDPIIGIRGARGGSPNIGVDVPVTTGFVTCDALGFSEMVGYICAEFNLPEQFTTGLYAVDLTFQQGSDVIPFNMLQLDQVFSGFTQATMVDEHTIRLFGGAAPDGALACGFVEDVAIPCIGGSNISPEQESTGFRAFSFLAPGDDAIVFLRALCGDGEIQVPCESTDPTAFTVTSVNAQNTPVPEPGTLLLMGVGVAAVAGRRFRLRAQ